jgi:hypothetical protein
MAEWSCGTAILAAKFVPQLFNTSGGSSLKLRVAAAAQFRTGREFFDNSLMNARKCQNRYVTDFRIIRCCDGMHVRHWRHKEPHLYVQGVVIEVIVRGIPDGRRTAFQTESYLR